MLEGAPSGTGLGLSITAFGDLSVSFVARPTTLARPARTPIMTAPMTHRAIRDLLLPGLIVVRSSA